MIVFPHAKINLGLNIVAERPDGYHDIETVFVPIGYADTLEVYLPGRQVDGGLVWDEVGGSLGVPTEKNLCVRALRALRGVVDVPTVGMVLRKSIPDGAGLGGGSSDAAFVLRTLNDLLGLGLSAAALRRVAAGLGADCPFFIEGRPVFASGVGDVFSPVNLSPLRGMGVVVVVPHGAVSTADAYRAVGCRVPDVRLADAVARPVDEWRDVVRNDFESYVSARLPDVLRLKERLYGAGALYAQMSGSGSAVFGLFRSAGALPPRSEFPEVRGYWAGPVDV